jgi:hypothetical protein
MTNMDSGEKPNGAALFEAANKLRGSVESEEYKHLVLGLSRVHLGFLRAAPPATPRRALS